VFFVCCSFEFDIFHQDVGYQEISMTNLHESKLAAVLKAIETLTVRTRALENFASGVGTSQGVETPQSIQHIAIQGPILLPSQGNNCSNQNLDDGATNFREPRVSLLEKFDDTRSKF
jgi:hypothetical protein